MAADSGDATEAAAVAEALARTEQWFVRQGLPHFVAGFSPARTVLTSALPVLGALFPVQFLAAIAPAPSWPRRFAGVALGVALVGLGHLLAARLRGHPVRRRPDRVRAELVAAFILVGPLAGLAVGVPPWWVAVAAVGNTLLAGAVYLVTTFALASVAMWTVRRVAHEITELAPLAGRGLPMLVLFGVLTFFSSDLWRVAVALSAARLWLVVGSFMLLTVVFLLVTLPEELRRLRTDQPDAAAHAACAGTPLAGYLDRTGGPVRPAALGPAQRANMLVFLLLSQMIQVALLTTVVWVFFMAFGALAVRPEVIAGWLGHGPRPAYALGVPLPGLSSEIVHVATLLSSLTAFYFTISAVTDAVYRAEFFSRTLAELARVVDVRRCYLTLRHRLGDAAAAGPAGDASGPARVTS
jgi:hypothetical protein